MKENPLIVALDIEPQELDPLLSELRGHIEIFKIGSRLFTSQGPKVVEKIHALGKKVFLDLKFHDIPNTVAQACRNAARMRVWGLTIHTFGGFAMMKEAAQAVLEESKTLRIQKPLIFGVTVLTSLSDLDLKQIGSGLSAKNQVERLALLAKKGGLDGIVASGQEIQLVRKALGKELLVLVPGIRLEKSAAGDQKRVISPRQALDLGANYIVVGRPILEAKEKAAAAREILKSIQ